MLKEEKLPDCFGRHLCWTYRQKRCPVEFYCRSERDARLRVNNPLPRPIRNAVVLPPLGADPLGITLNLGDNIPKRVLRKREGNWTVWTPQTKSGRYVWVEKFTSDELALAVSKIS